MRLRSPTRSMSQRGRRGSQSSADGCFTGHRLRTRTLLKNRTLAIVRGYRRNVPRIRHLDPCLLPPLTHQVLQRAQATLFHYGHAIRTCHASMLRRRSIPSNRLPPIRCDNPALDTSFRCYIRRSAIGVWNVAKVAARGNPRSVHATWRERRLSAGDARVRSFQGRAAGQLVL
jgi:hypothetical protein